MDGLRGTTGPSLRSASDARIKMRRVVYTMAGIIGVGTTLILVYMLRQLILPFLVGTFTAYLCFPLLRMAKRVGVPRWVAIILLFGMFSLAVTVLATQIQSLIPDERDQLVLRTRFQYKLNEKYRHFMDIKDDGDQGNFIYSYLGPDLNKMIANINTFLVLNRDERNLFVRYRMGYRGRPIIEDQYFEYFRKNLVAGNKVFDPEEAEEKAREDLKSAQPPAQREQSKVSALLEILELWIVMPFVFLFLLIDDGEIKRYFVSLVPNRYFELTLTVMHKVNSAIGNYLRGIMVECSLVGLAFIILFALMGFDLQLAVVIGIIAGIANAIPFLGPAIAFALGASYALIVEEVHSILPFMTADNLIIGVIVAVVLVRILDDAIFQPYIVGGAVHLHPLVVFIGVIGGSMLFGFVGLLLAIPTIVIVKELVATLFNELRDYYII